MPFPAITLSPATTSAGHQKIHDIPLLRERSTPVKQSASAPPLTATTTSATAHHSATAASTSNITANYRARYALYLAAQFNISPAAAFVELDEQFRTNALHRTSACAEADIRDVHSPGSF